MDNLDMVVLSVDEVPQTAALKSDDTDIPIMGVLEYIFIDLSGAASPNIDIDITTVDDSGTGAARTLWTDDDVTADQELCIRLGAVTPANVAITNEGGKIGIASKLRLSCSDSDKAGVNVKAYIFYSK